MAGRPRKYASNAEKQKAYRERNSVTKLVGDIQMCRKAIADHGPYQPDSGWIEQSGHLFTEFMRARRALLAADPHHPSAFRQWER